MPRSETAGNDVPAGGLDFLNRGELPPPPPVIAIYGEELFLKSQSLARLKQTILQGNDDEYAVAVFDGEKALLRELLDELRTVGLFGGGHRLVILDDADKFISEHRAALEDYVAKPCASSTLVIVAKSWLKTTRLSKALASSGWQIECSLPKPAQVAPWAIAWAKKRHRLRLPREVADLLAERIGPELGLLDQELAKLAVVAGEDQGISVEAARELVGGWRAKTVWDVLDTAAMGDAPAAIALLDRLLASGEQPLGALGMMAPSLRRFAGATRMVEQAEAEGRRPNLRQCLEQVGVKGFFLDKSESQLKQLGRKRAGRLYRALLKADLDLKGDSQLPPRMILERLIVQLSKKAAPR